MLCAGSRAKIARQSGMTTTAVPTRSSTNTAIVRPPMRPIDRRSAADATPVMSSDTTSGITVIRIALTQSVPDRRDEVGGAQQRFVPDRGDRHSAGDRRAKRDEYPRAFFH